MIHVFFPAPVSGETILRVHGHSGKAEKGNDTVCAGVSTLVQTFAGGVEKTFSGQISGVFETGNCDITVRVPEHLHDELNKVCEIFRYGFRKIAESYPEHVKLN